MRLVFDIGGTTMRVAQSLDNRTISDHQSLPTPQDFTQGIEQLIQTAKGLMKDQPLELISGGIAGVLNPDKSLLLNSPHLTEWINQPLKDRLAAEFKVPVILENDASLGGLGEANFGAGKDHSIVGYLSIGTGVGGTKIVNQRIDPNAYGFEPGHQIIDPNGPLCQRCQVNGHLESFISGSALMTKFNKPASEIDDPAVWEEIARILAIGIHNSLVYWSPEIMVIGGSVGKQIDLNQVTHYLQHYSTIFPQLPELKAATLGDLSGAYGALALSFHSEPSY